MGINVNEVVGKLEQKYKDPQRGLTSEDRLKIVEALKQAERQRNFKACIRLKSLLDVLEKSDILYKYAYQNYVYVREHLPILPLPYANEQVVRETFKKENGIKLYCAGNSKKLLSVYRNRIIEYTKPEHPKYNNIQYIQKCEDIDYDKAFELLCAIYNCKLPNNRQNQKVVNMYKDIIVSKRYEDVLNASKANSIEKGLYSKKIEKYFNEMFEIINRIKEDKTDSNFEYKKPDKILVKK